MRVKDEVTAEKLRGGFYSPQALVERCLDRQAVHRRGERDGGRIVDAEAGRHDRPERRAGEWDGLRRAGRARRVRSDDRQGR